MDAQSPPASPGAPAPAHDAPGRLDALTAHLAGLVSLVGPDGTVLAQYGSPDLTGRAPAERIGRPLFEFAHAEELGRATAWLGKLAKAPAGAMPDELDLRALHADGSWRQLRLRGTNLLADPRVGALLVEATDETRRRTAQLSAERLRDRLHLAAESMRMGFFDYDVTADCFEISKECDLMRGISPAVDRRVRGTEIVGNIHPADRAASHAELEMAIRGPSDDWDAEYRLPTASGEWLWIQQRARVLERDASGRATRIAGVLLDIDRRKRAERGLAYSEARYRTIVAMTRGFVHETVRAEDGRALLQWASEGFTRLLGWTVAELNERGGWTSIIHPDLLAAAADRRVRVFGGEPVHAETRLRTKSGEWLWFDVSLFPLQEPESGRVLSSMGTLFDITARKQAEELLRASEERFRIAATAVQGVIYEREVASGVVTCSGNVHDLLGLGPDALVASLEWWDQHVHPDDLGHYRRSTVLPSDAHIITVEYRLRHASGHYVDVVDRSIVVRDQRGLPVRVVGCAIDVSAVRRAERLLLEAEALAHVGSWQLDVGSGELTFSDEATRIAGVVRDGAAGDLKALFSYVAPESAPALREAIERALATGAGYNLDLEIVRRDGQRRWLRTSGRAELVDGRTVRLYGAFQDIDALKRGELKLREQSERLRLTLDAGQLAAWRWNPRDDSLVVEYRSAGFDPLITFAPTMSEDLATVDAGDRAQASAALAAVLERGEPAEFELGFRDATGTQRWLRSRMMRAETSEGPIVTGTTFEITARRLAEDALRASESMLRSIADNAPDLIAIVGRDLRVRFVNRPLRGEAPEQIVGRPAASYASDDPEWFESRLAEVIATGQPVRFESSATRDDGGAAIFEVRVGPVRDGDRITGAILYSTNITERRALEREILEISNREQRRIGSDLHDGLGQELTGIAFMLGSLTRARRRGVVPKPAELQELADLVNGAIEQTRALARGLSPVALDGGNLAQALRTLVARAREMYGLNVRFRSRLSARITLDAAVTGHLYRIAQESLNNAARHAAASAVVVHLSVSGARVSLTVSDDGHGIAPGAGGGVGLKIMRYRAHMIGGELLIGPRPDGRGTRVTCVLNQAEPAGRSAQARQHA